MECGVCFMSLSDKVTASSSSSSCVVMSVSIVFRLSLKVSFQSRKFKFNVYIQDRFQENKIFQTAQIMNNILRSSKKW